MNSQRNALGTGNVHRWLFASLLVGVFIVWSGGPLAAQTSVACAPAVADGAGWHSVRPFTAGQPPAGRPSSSQTAAAVYRTVSSQAVSAESVSTETVWRPSGPTPSPAADQQRVEVTAWRPVDACAACSNAAVVPAGGSCVVPASGSATYAAYSAGTPYYACSPYCGYSPAASCGPCGAGSYAVRLPVVYAAASPCQPAYAGPNVVYRPAVPRFVLPGGNWANRPLIVKPKVYVPGQPVRNLLRAILP